jgi:hypothetical protein
MKVLSPNLKDNTMVMAAFHRNLAVTFVAIDCIVNMARHSRDETAHKHTECYEHIYRQTHTMHTLETATGHRDVLTSWGECGKLI